MQIDGLSRVALEQGLASGYMPFLKRLLKRHDYRLEPMSVGLPTSTPAFQMAAMYGVRPDIPGFHYYDRAQRCDIHFPRPGHAASVEARQAASQRGILEGGSAYGCVFTGGAENNFFSFASITQPSGRGLASALSPFVVVLWVCGKNLGRTVIEFSRAIVRLVADPVAGRQGWRWLTMKIGISVWVSGFFTMAVSRDLYAGVSPVYVNYVDYDVAAHAFGPRSRQAMRFLRHVDHSIHQLWRVMRRVPEHRYDFYILSDHGQASCTPYRAISKGVRLERRIFDEFLEPAQAGAPDLRTRSGLARGLRTRQQGIRALLQHFVNYLEEDFVRRKDPEAHEQNGIRVISAGPNAFLYALDAAMPLDADALESRFPKLAVALSRSAGIGFVLLRSPNGPLCFWQGKRYQLRDSEPGPFAGREDVALVIQGVADLMQMPSAGDLVIYGIDAPEGHVSFIPESGAHAGPSHDEMHTFIVRPANVALPLPISHPVQLYDHFIRYQRMA